MNSNYSIYSAIKQKKCLDAETVTRFKNVKNTFLSIIDKEKSAFCYSTSQPNSPRPCICKNEDKEWTDERVFELLTYFNGNPNMGLKSFKKNSRFPPCLQSFNEGECERKLSKIRDIFMFNYKFEQDPITEPIIYQQESNDIKTSDDFNKYINKLQNEYFNKFQNTKESIQSNNNLKELYKCLIDYLDEYDKDEENYQHIEDKLTEITNEEQDKIKILLYIINDISLYHYRNHHFFQKIEKIILILILDNKNRLNININEDEILNIFIENKRILLFLQEEHIINNKNRLISKIVTNNKLIERNYIEYFSKEMQELMNEETNENIQKIKEEYLNTGENEKQICQIIRQDSIDDFINYLTTNNVHINDYIPPSIYETNILLLKHKKVSLIDYASFYGSINIFNYLKMKCAIIDYQTYKFAIHSDNQIMISNFEEYIKQDIKKCLKYYRVCKRSNSITTKSTTNHNDNDNSTISANSKNIVTTK